MRATLGIGVLGTGWMAKAHTHALRALSTTLELPFDIRLVSLGGRAADRTEAMRARWGFESSTTDWRQLVDNPEVDVVVNLTGNAMHAAPSIGALETGKHVLCEKPLATTRADVAAMLQAARSSAAVNACGYNYRFVPAVRLARELVLSGRLGRLRHVNIGYEQDWASKDSARHGWRFEDPVEGSSVYDLSHIIDLLRWIGGEPSMVIASIAARTPADAAAGSAGIKETIIGQDHEDSYSALVRMESGIVANLRGSRIATGRKGSQFLEITGEEGSLLWNMEDLNRLQVYLQSDDGGSQLAGYRNVMATELEHPFMDYWYAPGHTIGWDHTVIHQWISVLAAITGFNPDIPTDFARFEDGARAAATADTIRVSAHDQKWTPVPIAEKPTEHGLLLPAG